MTFTECDTCRAKPGCPALCSGCLANRKRIGELEAALAKLTAEPPTCEEPDPPIVRLQFPDGSVPEDLRECAEGWKRHYERKLSDWQTMMQQRDRALRELEREERDHIETIDHRDKHEERINTIVRELGLGEYESSWTSHNDPSERAIEAICELQRQSQQPDPEVIEGRGQLVTEEQEGDWLYVSKLNPENKPDVSRKELGEAFDKSYRYMRCPTFPPRPTFQPPPKPELKLVRHKSTGTVLWTMERGDMSVWEILDPATGNPVGE